jgi:hypothetical protein
MANRLRMKEGRAGGGQDIEELARQGAGYSFYF